MRKVLAVMLLASAAFLITLLAGCISEGQGEKWTFTTGGFSIEHKNFPDSRGEFKNRRAFDPQAMQFWREYNSSDEMARRDIDVLLRFLPEDHPDRAGLVRIRDVLWPRTEDEADASN